MKIAIFGATSEIAKDLVNSIAIYTRYECTLFSRAPALCKKTLDLTKMNYTYLGYPDFSIDLDFDVILNFIGVGSPIKALEMGSKILDVTYQYDSIIIDYLKSNRDSRYIFLSSGAVFGSDFSQPVNSESVSKITINDLGDSDWYSLAKLYAEVRHRALPELNIYDVRVFNYFSHTQEIKSGFFMSDVIVALVNNEVLATSPENIVRDYITPIDFFNLVDSIFRSQPLNLALDCYTKDPIKKFDLLIGLENKFGLKHEVMDVKNINATGCKSNYYSLNNAAEKIGYQPEMSSLEGIYNEIALLLKSGVE